MANPFADLIPAPKAQNAFADLIPAKAKPRPDAATVAKRADIAQSDGFFDRVGDLLSRGAAGVSGGLQSLMGAVEDFNAGPSMEWNRAPWSADPVAARDLHRVKAQRDRAIAATPMQNEVTWDTVKAKPSVANIGKFIVEGGVQSLPGMAAAATSLPLYMGSLVGQIGQQRAENDGRENLTLADAGAATPFAILSGAAERLGAKGIVSSVGRNAGTRILASGAREGLTEAAQTGLEYTGGSAGTEQGFDLSDALNQMAAGSLVGMGVGGTGRAAIETPGAAVSASTGLARTVKPYLMKPVRAELPAPDVAVSNDNVFADLIPAPIEPPAVAPAPVAVDPQPVATPKPAVAGGDGLGQAAPAPTLPDGRPRFTITQEPALPSPAPVELPAPKVEADTLRPDPGELGEGERIVRTPAGGSIRTRFEVVDAASLAQAEGANQNRDRSRDTTTLQVQDIISKFDPELLAEDPSSDRGAPIVGADNSVDSGNGRVLTLSKIYEQYPEQAAKYRAMIEARGHAIPEGVTNPVLIQRRMTDFTPDQRRQFVIDSNKDTKLSLSPVERARSDADTITPDMLAKYAGGDLNSSGNQGFVAAFTGNLMTGEMGDMIGSDRRLTPNGLQRIENAVVAAAYGKPKLLERMMESSNDDIRAITGSMADVAPAWAALRQSAKAGDIDVAYDITDDLADAAARLSDARKAGTRPGDILAQADAFDQMSPVTAELIRAFHNSAMSRAASRKAVTALLGDYVAAAKSEKASDGLFGPEPKRPPVAILKALLEQRDNPNGAGLALDDAPITKETGDGPIGRTNKIRGAQSDREARPEARGRAGGADELGNRASESEARDAGGEPAADRADAGRSRNGDARRDADGGDASAVRDRGTDEPDGATSRDAAGDDGGARAAGDGRGDRRGKPDAKDGRDLADEDKGAYQAGFAEASFTNRQSVYVSAIEAVGLDEQKFNLLPPARKVKLLSDALENLTGVTTTLAPDMPLQFAIDQLLDAHQTLQGMASALGINPMGLSLGGSLKLKLVKGANFLGSYNSGKGEITLPKRSNSFAHEWGHALDYHLLDTVGGEGRGLSGAVREDGADFQPGNVREAFVNLLNAMFFDGAQIAQKVMRLQRDIERTKSPKMKAALQAQIDNIMSGRSRAKEKSRYWQGADAVNKAGGEGDYWTRPTEMLARAFEAWVAFKMANEGRGNEFVTKGNDNYLSDAEDRFRLTFPKDQERVQIFDAFQKLIDAVNVEQMIDGAGNPSIRHASGFNAVATPAMNRVAGQAQNKARNIIGRALEADLESVSTWFHNRKVNKAEDERRAASPMTIGAKVNNVRSLAFSAASDGVKMVAARWGSQAARDIHDHFAHDLGGTRHVTRTWADTVDMRENRALNPVFKQLEKIGGKGWVYKKLTREQNDALAALLNATPLADDLGLTPLADAMRRTFNNEWYENQNAGIDLGYVKDGAYLNRQIDRELVAGDVDVFVEKAALVFELVFDRDVGSDPDAIATDEARLDRFVALAKTYRVDGHGELKKAIKDESDDVAELIERMLPAVREGFAMQSASDYRDAILHAETFGDNIASYALPDSEKRRSFPAEADAILRDFYNPSPVSSLVHYVQASIRRTEWNKRFGHPAGAKKSAPSLGKQLDERMAADGVPAEDRRYVWSLVDRMSGRYQRTGFLANPGVANALGFLRVKGTLAMMGRAFTLSLFEPAGLGIVTQNPTYGVKAVAATWGNVLLKGSRQERMEWARAQGFIKHHLLEQFTVDDRFGTTSDSPTKWDRLAGVMFRNTGLTFLTAASDAAVIDVTRRGVINDAAHRVVEGGVRGKEAANLMRELGIRDPDAFAAQIVALNGAVPSPEWMSSAEGFDYNTALMRIAKMTIQKPGAADLAPLGRNPLASYATYSITAYLQSAYRNMLKRNIIKGARLARAGEHEMLARMVGGAVLSAAMLYALQFLSSAVREYLFNPERQKRWKDDDEWLENSLALAGTRTFSFGAFDPVLDAWSGLRYNRDFAYLPLGAYAGADAKNVTTTAKFFASNSRKNNTAEHNTLNSLYQFALAPAVAGGISAAPGGGPLLTALGGAAIATSTSPVSADHFATSIVGKKNGSLDAEGKKIKSGPSGYDEFLNGAFGEVKKKSAD